MKPEFETPDGKVAIYKGDCVERMLDLPECSVDAIVTDPPYLVSMDKGMGWDASSGPDLPRSEALFRAWFAGLIAGDGYFRIHTCKDGAYYSCHFGINMRADEGPMLRALHRKLGFGTIHEEGECTNSYGVESNPKVKFVVQSKEDCWKIAKILDGTPLYAKKQREYDLWRRALQVWTDTERGSKYSPRDNEPMRKLYEEMKTLRPFDLELAASNFDPFGQPNYLFHHKWARSAFRALKPGGFLLSFCATRTYHEMASGVEDAGFEIRDMLTWSYIQGVAKGMDVSKAFDRNLGVEDQRGYIPVRGGVGNGSKRSVIKFVGKHEGMYLDPNNPISEEAKRYHGWNTALKPSIENICMARKPFDGSLLDNLRKWEVGALNVAECAIKREAPAKEKTESLFDIGETKNPDPPETYYPSNMIISEEAREFMEQFHGEQWTRQFYCPKPDKAEYAAGLDPNAKDGDEVIHPTLKPIDLMAYLIKLVVPAGATICDPFAGSGTTALAALRVGRKCILIEREEKYIEVEKRRILDYLAQPALF